MEVSDRTSQEYLTALEINDWDYFLPRNHVNSPVKGKEYRIFQPQWKQIILFWLGRNDIDSEEKEAFIQKLVNFDDGCGEWSYKKADKGFYEYQAYFLAAAGINEFKKCSLLDKFVEQIVKWGFGYFDIEKQEWITFIDPIAKGARIVLAETIIEKAITNLIQILKANEDESTRWRVAYSLGKIDPGNELAIRELIRALETTKFKDTRCWEVAEILGKIAIGNELAVQELIQVIETTESEYTRRTVAYILGKIAVGNKLAMQALIQVLKTTNNKSTRWSFGEILGKIAVGNELAIQELIQVLKTTNYEDTRRQVAYTLEKIAIGNELAMQALIQVLENTNDEDTRRVVADSLGKIIQTQKQYTDVIFVLKNHLNNEVYENNFDLFENCYKILWNIAKNLPDPKFYQAWHHKTFTPNANNNSCHSEGSEESQRSFAALRSAQDDIIKNSEITDNTPVDNAPIVRQLEQQLTDIFTQLSHLPLHCINVNKLLTLNTESKFVQGFCNRLYQKVLPDQTIPKVQTITDLERKIIHLKQQLQTPHPFILLLGDGTPTPEVIDCCDYLTEVLHLGWVTPDPDGVTTPLKG